VSQIQLFAIDPELPEGFVYKPEFITHEEEQALVRAIEQLDFTEVKMRDVVAKRRVVHFGRSYEYETAALTFAPPNPEFLTPLRQRGVRGARSGGVCGGTRDQLSARGSDWVAS